jgi:hypothetical protein
MALTDLPLRALRERLSKPFVPSLKTPIRPAILPKSDNGAEFQVVSIVNHLRYFAAERGAVSCVSLFVVFDVESATVEPAVYDWNDWELSEIPPTEVICQTGWQTHSNRHET